MERSQKWLAGLTFLLLAAAGLFFWLKPGNKLEIWESSKQNWTELETKMAGKKYIKPDAKKKKKYKKNKNKNKNIDAQSGSGNNASGDSSADSK